MTVKAIFLHRDETDDVGLVFAARLAQLMGLPLHAVCALPDPSNVYAYSTPEFAIGVTTAVSREIIASQETAVADSKAAFDRIVQEVGLTGLETGFFHKTGFPPQVAAEEALLADALVVPRAAAKRGHALSGACEHVLMDNGLPVIVAGSSARAAGPIILAWDGSEQAARSVRFHLSIIRRMERVIIAQNSDTLKGRFRGEAHSPDALQAWLKQKGVESEINALSGHVGHALLDLAVTENASLIVAGAYGHSRAGEYLFGGVTRTLMHAESAPALALCH